MSVDLSRRLGVFFRALGGFSFVAFLGLVGCASARVIEKDVMSNVVMNDNVFIILNLNRKSGSV